MSFIRKPFFPLILLSLIYLFTRLCHLLTLPIFTDESIYIYWAKIIATTHSHWFISLTDGKPPLLVWMTAIFLKIFPSRWYLLAGRLPSVIAGLISLIGVYKLTILLFGKWEARGGEPHGRGPLTGSHGAAEWQDPFSKARQIAHLASFLYIFNPFSLFYDRMALFDSLLTATLLWSVYFALKTAKTHHIKDALLWGIFLGLGYLSKPTAVIFLFLTPVCFLLFSKKEFIFKNWKKSIWLVFTALLIGELINNLQRLSHVYYLMAAKNQQFQQPWDKLLKNPFELTYGNLHGFFSWLIPYYTWPIFILGLIALILLLLKNRSIGLILGLLWFAPIFVLSTFGREIFPRYILFTTPYFLIALAFFITLITNRPKTGLTPPQRELIQLIVTFLILLPSFRFDYFILVNPPAASFPDVDYHQYVSEHPSGYGLDPIFGFIDKESQKGPLNLIIQGTFGLYPYAFNLQFWNNPNVKINPRWPLTSIDKDIIVMAKTTPTFILLKEHDQIPPDLPLKLVLKSEKPGGRYPLLLTQLK